MNYLDIQVATAAEGIPSPEQFQRWVDSVLHDQSGDNEIVIRLVDEAESAELNRQYRNKIGPTNILSFPFEAPEQVQIDLLGDLVICAPVLAREACEQGKSLLAHWAHITIHGLLHLLGYDHIDDEEAEQMEALEIELLGKLNIANPYSPESTQ